MCHLLKFSTLLILFLGKYGFVLLFEKKHLLNYVTRRIKIIVKCVGFPLFSFHWLKWEAKFSHVRMLLLPFFLGTSFGRISIFTHYYMGKLDSTQCLQTKRHGPIRSEHGGTWHQETPSKTAASCSWRHNDGISVEFPESCFHTGHAPCSVDIVGNDCTEAKFGRKFEKWRQHFGW